MNLLPAWLAIITVRNTGDEDEEGDDADDADDADDILEDASRLSSSAAIISGLFGVSNNPMI